MNTGIISQIQKITGVKTVEPAGKDMAVVVFEGQKPLFMTEDGIETFDGEKYWFVNKNSKDPIALSSVAQSFDLVDSNIRFSTLKAAEDWIASRKQKQKEAELIKGAEKRGFVMGAKHTGTGDLGVGYYFTIDDDLHFTNGRLYGGKNGCIYNGKEWATVESKPKSLKPEELVEGEIYVDTEGIQSPRIIRFMRIFDDIGIDIYSQIMSTSRYEGLTSGYRFDFLRPATLEEKQKLVKAEVSNGFYYGLK